MKKMKNLSWNKLKKKMIMEQIQMYFGLIVMD